MKANHEKAHFLVSATGRRFLVLGLSVAMMSFTLPMMAESPTEVILPIPK